MRYIASCSCGKDSLAMVYKIIEQQLPLNEIVFYDTGMEFQSIYNNWKQLTEYAQRFGIKCTTLHPKCPFLYTMFEQPHCSRKDGIVRYGYSWCGGYCRWGTNEKLKSIDKYCEQQEAICYVGIAADEPQRLEKEHKTYKRYPLVEWNMSEVDSLQYCRKHNISWIEKCRAKLEGRFFIDLYTILDRVSCWCCANKNHWELYNYWKYLPDYWEKLKEIQRKTQRPFNKYTIFEMEEKFDNGYIPRHRTKLKRKQ